MRRTCSPHFEASKKSWWVQNFKRHWEHMFIWSNSFSGTPKIISKHIPSLVKIYSLRKIPRSNDEHEWKYQHHEQDACMEELMKDISTQLQRIEEIHGPQAEDVFGKPKERMLFPNTPLKREANLMSFTCHCQRPLKSYLRRVTSSHLNLLFFQFYSQALGKWMSNALFTKS